MIKALFFDIDGTLVGLETHRIADSTVKALTEAHAKGLKIIIATGRTKAIINNLGQLDERKLIDGYITMNGAYCFIGSHVIYKGTIPASDVRLVADYCQKKSLPCIFVNEHSLSVCQPDDHFRYLFYEYLHAVKIPETSFVEAMKDEIYQLTPFITKEDEELLRPNLSACEIERWHPAFADITALGNTKQHGLEVVARFMGWKKEELMAFGDGGNDCGMLRYAGVGVAMGQAEEHVKAAADYVTTSVDEDGIANALRHYGLIE